MLPIVAQAEARDLAAPQKGMLRFLTCGSVDDGKSTLIGRLVQRQLNGVPGYVGGHGPELHIDPKEAVPIGHYNCRGVLVLYPHPRTHNGLAQQPAEQIHQIPFQPVFTHG